MGVTLEAPGALTLRFSSPEELLGCLLALADDAAANDPAFAKRLAEGTMGRATGPGQGRAIITVAISRDRPLFEGPLDPLLTLVRRNHTRSTPCPSQESPASTMPVWGM